MDDDKEICTACGTMALSQLTIQRGDEHLCRSCDEETTGMTLDSGDEEDDDDKDGYIDNLSLYAEELEREERSME